MDKGGMLDLSNEKDRDELTRRLSRMKRKDPQRFITDPAGVFTDCLLGTAKTAMLAKADAANVCGACGAPRRPGSCVGEDLASNGRGGASYTVVPLCDKCAGHVVAAGQRKKGPHPAGGMEGLH